MKNISYSIEFRRRMFVLRRLLPFDSPSLLLKRFKNLLTSFMAWKYGIHIGVAKPCTLQIEPVRGCNLNCIMCRAGELEKKFLSFEDFKRILNFFQEAFIVFLNYGGEPFLSRDILGMVKYASYERKMIVHLFSNFTILPEPRDVINSGIYEIHASIDTFNPEKFSKIRINGDLNKVTSNLKKLVEERRKQGKVLPIISINVVTMKETIEDAEDIIENATKIGVDRVEFSRAFLRYGINPEINLPDKRDIGQYIRLKQKYSDRIEVLLHNFEFGDKHTPGFCHYAYFMGMISIEGYFFPCCMMYAFFDPNSRFGNVFEDTSEILERRRDFIMNFRKTKPSPCLSCHLYYRP